MRYNDNDSGFFFALGVVAISPFALLLIVGVAIAINGPDNSKTPVGSGGLGAVNEVTHAQ